MHISPDLPAGSRKGETGLIMSKNGGARRRRTYMAATNADVTRGRYFDLVVKLPLRPIRSDDELGRAIAMVDSLVDLDELDPGERDYLDVLSDLIEKYEAEHDPLPAVSEADMLRHLIEARGVTQLQVAEDTSIAKTTISAILSGKRGLSRNHIVALARYFKVSPAVFISTCS